MTKKTLLVHCPICKTLVPRDDESFPFCGERCKTIDLGNWASDAYAIPDKSDHDDNNDIYPPIIH